MAASFAANPLLAQTGGLEVWVFDAADRSPLAGVTVSLTNEQHLVAPTALLTDEQGRARFPVLRSGRGYAVQVSLPAFGTQRSTGHRVRSNETERLVFQLSPEQLETVRVSARKDVIDLNQAATTARFSEEFIQELPVPGRFYQNMLSLAPGVNDADVKYRFRYPTSQRNDQRNADFWNVDVMVAKNFALDKAFHLQLSAEIFNLINDDTVILTDQLDGANSGVRRFGRRYQLGLRLAF